MDNIQFSLPAASVAELGSRLVKVLGSYASTTIVTANDHELQVAVNIGPAWLELSQAANVTCPGSLTKKGLFSPMAQYDDGIYSYRIENDRLVMQGSSGTWAACPVGPVPIGSYVSGPHCRQGALDACLLKHVVKVLPSSFGGEFNFGRGAAFVGNHLKNCCAWHPGLQAEWSLPLKLLPLLKVLLNQVEGNLDIRRDAARTGIAFDGAFLHWPNVALSSFPPKWQGQGSASKLDRRKAKILAKLHGSEARGSIILERQDGVLRAEFRSDQGKGKGTVTLPCGGDVLPKISCPFDQFCAVFGQLRSDDIAFFHRSGQLHVREVRDDLEVTYAIPAASARG